MAFRNLWAAGLLLLATGVAHAANPYLKQAREKYQELDYPALPAILAEAVQQPGTSRDEFVEIYKLQGFAYTVLGDAPKAREAFLRLLIVEPGYQLEGSVSPRFRGAFTDAKKEFEKNGTVVLTHDPPRGDLRVGAGVDVEVTLQDTFSRAAQAAAEVRTVMGGKEGAFVNVPLKSTAFAAGKRSFKGHLPDPAASIPGAKPAGYYLEYRFTFVNLVGDPVPVSGGQPQYRLTVGDPAAAASTVAAAPVEPARSSGGGPPLWPLALVGAGAGAGLLGLVTVGVLGVGTGVAVGAVCYLQGTCNPTQESSIGRVTVEVER